MGKPSKFFFDCIKQVKPDIKEDRCLMIGDRLDSDIKWANNNNFRWSLFVESGVSSLENVKLAIETGQEKLVPTHYCSDLGVLNKFLNVLLENKLKSN